MLRMITEACLLLAVGWQVHRGILSAVQETLIQAAQRSGTQRRTEAAFASDAQLAFLCWAGGIAALFFAHHWAHRRAPRSIAAPFLVLAVAVATGLGLAILVGYGDPLHLVDPKMASRLGLGQGWPGLKFGQGVLGGALLGATLLLILSIRLPIIQRIDDQLDSRWLWIVLGLLAVALVSPLLYFKLNAVDAKATKPVIDWTLGPITFQPVEPAKLAFLGSVSGLLAWTAGRLRYHRRRVAGVPLPRLELLAPVLLLVAGLFGLLFGVGDYGPMLVLIIPLVALTWMSSRATTETVLVLLVTVVGWWLLSTPELLPSKVLHRIQMAQVPWNNGLSHGDQLGRALWAFAAGGLTGQGLGAGHIQAIPAGHTDLVLAHLGESLGFIGLATYHAAMWLLIIQGYWIAAYNRTRTRMLLAAGIATLLLAQWLVIFAGSVGWLPLTGIVVPFLSSGRTSMIVFMLAVAILARLAHGGRPTTQEDALEQLRPGAFGLAAIATVLFAGGTWISFDRCVIQRDATTLQVLKTVQSDGKTRSLDDPRLMAVAKELPRGTIYDRNGAPLAHTDDAGVRQYPLKDALGTLLGWVPRPRAWQGAHAIERAFNARLRGLGEAAKIDIKRLLPLTRMSPARRRAAIAEMVADEASRAVHTTLDARLQRALAERLARAIKPHTTAPAAAAVIIDVDTGEVLARAQVPDFDPGQFDPLKRTPLDAGTYGVNVDKTGERTGRHQAGSVMKVATALAALRSGQVRAQGAGCEATTTPTYACTQTHDRHPSFTRPGWERPIHDFGGRTHGPVDIALGLEVSCNVHFGQLGLALGPEPLLALHAAGLKLGRDRLTRDRRQPWHPGPADSRRLAETAFGQGAATLNVVTAARLAAVIAGGGVLRTCDPHLHKAPCEAKPLIEAERLAPIIAGMHRVVHGSRGTGRRQLDRTPGLRLYGKTGTADDPVRREERPYGVRRATPHAWFIGFAEPESTPPCAIATPGRLAVAVVVLRGGHGSDAAPIAADVLNSARELGYLGGGTP